MSEKPFSKNPLQKVSSPETVSTERTEAEGKLRENEQLFRSLTEKSLAAAFIVQDGRFRYINTSAIAYAGYTAEELIGRDSDIIVHPEDREMVKEKAREMLQGRDSSPYEFRMVTKEGKIRYIIQIVSPIQYNGEPAILGNAIDVTERKQAEEALRESEMRLADIIDFLPDATLAIDREGRVIAWNRAIEEMTGVKASDMLGKGDYEYALPFYSVRRPILINLVFGYDEEIEKKYHFIRKEGDVLLTEADVPLRGGQYVLWAKASPLYDSKGDVVGAIESIRDITEHKKAERIIQESEEKYRSLASTVDLMYLVDKDCRYLFMNEGHLLRFGITLGEMEGRSYKEFHSKEDAREFEDIVKRIFETGQSTQHEHRSGRDGRYFLRTLSPVKDPEGLTTAVTVVSKDITERKRVEEALRESERRLADIIDFLPDATLAIDREGRVIAWNRAIEEMTGVKASEMLGRGNHEYSLPFYGARRPILIDLVFGYDEEVEKEYRFIRKEGDVLLTEADVPLRGGQYVLWAKASPLYDSKGDVVGAIESIRDITERRRLDELLRMSEEKYRQLFTTVPDAIFIFDAETRQIIDVNESSLRLYGYSRDEFLKLKYADITAEPEESEKAIEITITGKMHRVPLRYHRKNDETVFPVEASTSMFNLEGRDVICIVVRDITERKQAEEALKESEERYRTLFESTVNPILVIDTDGNYITCNDAALQFFQCTQREILSKNLLDFLPPQKERREREMHKALWRSGGTVETEYYIRGKIKFMEMTITPTTWRGKNVVLGIGKDITKRKQAEEALRESERRLADIIDFLPDATLAIDRQGKVIAWNHAMEEMTGVKASDMLGKGDYEYALPFYSIRRPILLDLVLKTDKKIERSYYSILKKEKDLLIVETWVPFLKWRRAFLWAKASPLYDSKGKIVGAIESIRDITERKHAEEALEKRENELETKTLELEDLNAALRVLLKQREEDRSELEQKVLSNVKVLILPQIEKLKNHLDLKGMSYINVLESNLKDIISPFAQKLSVKYLNLTNREVQIANLIKEGKTTKEIASFLNVSESAINVYRYHVRRKLSLTKKHNLRSYLSSLI